MITIFAGALFSYIRPIIYRTSTDPMPWVTLLSMARWLFIPVTLLLDRLCQYVAATVMYATYRFYVRDRITARLSSTDVGNQLSSNEFMEKLHAAYVAVLDDAPWYVHLPKDFLYYTLVYRVFHTKIGPVTLTLSAAGVVAAALNDALYVSVLAKLL